MTHSRLNDNFEQQRRVDNHFKVIFEDALERADLVCSLKSKIMIDVESL